MITRHYFASYVKYHDDGRGSFSWQAFTFTRRSWFAQQDQAYADALIDAREMMKDRPGSDKNIQCVAFNRI